MIRVDVWCCVIYVVVPAYMHFTINYVICCCISAGLVSVF